MDFRSELAWRLLERLVGNVYFDGLGGVFIRSALGGATTRIAAAEN